MLEINDVNAEFATDVKSVDELLAHKSWLAVYPSHPLLLYPTKRLVYVHVWDPRQNCLIKIDDFKQHFAPHLLNGAHHKISGPAINVDNKFEGSANIDNVFCIKLPTWPSVANEWQKRDRKGSHPSCQLVAKIVNDGCHIVPVGCKLSENREYEWRLSFSMAEVDVFANASAFQRQCGYLFRYLVKACVSPAKVVVTYWMKTIIMWHMDEMLDDWWTSDKPGNIVVHFIKKLLEAMKAKFLCHYFVRDFNLLQDIQVIQKMRCYIIVYNEISLTNKCIHKQIYK